MGRALGFIGLLIALAIGAYLYTRQTRAVAPEAASPRAAVDVAGVRRDLLTLANAERGFFALEGRYASFDELQSSGQVSMKSPRRGPYEYSIDTSDAGFRVTATYDGPPGTGAAASISIDQEMRFSSEP